MDNAFNGPNAGQAAQGQMVPYAGPMLGPGLGSESLFHIFARSWWLILLLAALGVGGAFFYLKELAPEPLYTSTSRLLIERVASNRDGTEVHDVGAASKSFHQTQAALIMSRQILNLALNDPNLLTLTGASDPNYLGDLVGTFAARVARDADIINISASAPYPADAARFVNTVVRAYRRWHERNRVVGTADTLRELDRQLAQYQSELGRKRNALRQLEERREAATGSVDVTTEKLELLRQQVASARATAEEHRLYYERLQRYEDDPESFRKYALAFRPSQGFAVDDRKRTRLEDELQATERQLDAIQAGAVVARHSQITRMEERKAELEQEIEQFDRDFVVNHLSLVKMAMDDKVSRADELAEAYSEERGKLRMTSSVEGEYEDLLSECRILEALRDNHVQKIQQVQMQMPEGLKIHVLEEAVPAGKPGSVQTARVLGIGLVAGIMLGSGLAFVRDWRDQTVRSADEIMAILGAPMLGAIPKVPRRRALARGKNTGFTPNSRESEACRAIRTALFFGVPQHKNATLLVTSPGPQEGKTTLVSNLGIAMARAGQKTLIIDADLRKPMQKRIFAMTDTGRGLTDLLADTAELDETIRPTEVEGLDVLVSGQCVPNPSEMLNSSAFSDVLGQLKERYDRIIVDSPPVGVVTDGQILATLCDLTLIVLRAKHSNRQVTQRARDALHTVGANVAGAVVNDVSRRDRRYSHYSGYGYYYGSRPRNPKAVSKQLPADVASDSEDELLASGPDYWEKMFRQS